jgi:arylsulfatase A-like enzyme
MTTRPIILVPLALALVAAIVRGGAASGPEKPPNIVLIVLDDIGFEVLDFWPDLPMPLPPGVMGRPPTPWLQFLADTGIIFTNAWASPVCSPSRMQILTGRHAHRTGVGSIVTRDSMLEVDDSERYLPEVIKVNSNPNGYFAGAFGKWHLAPLQNGMVCNLDHPIRSGFDIFKGHMWNVASGPGVGHHFLWEKVEVSTTPVNCTPLPMVTEWSATVTRRDAMDWVASLPPEDSFFAYIAFNAPHDPLQVPPLGLLSSATQSYIAGLTNPATGNPYVAGNSPGVPGIRICGDMNYPNLFGRHVEVFNWMVEAVDAEIGKIVRKLEMLGRLDDTVIFVISDNGTAERSLDCPLVQEHAKGSIYQLGTRVPLIIWGPRVVDRADEGSVCDELVSAVDLWPTIAETAGIVDPDQYLAMGYTLDGKSFSHLIADPSTAVSLRNYALIENFTGHRPHYDRAAIDFQRSVVEASGYKYVQQFWTEPPPMNNDADEFLYLPTDTEETINLAAFGAPMGGRSPCPYACPGGLQKDGTLQTVSCVVTPPCDLFLLYGLFNNYYAPLLCPCLTTN